MASLPARIHSSTLWKKPLKFLGRILCLILARLTSSQSRHVTKAGQHPISLMTLYVETRVAADSRLRGAWEGCRGCLPGPQGYLGLV